MLDESGRIDRLMGLCHLWGAVKFFQPYLAYRDDIDWDAALVVTIPKVNTATDDDAYSTAVQEMLAALGDPVTHVIHYTPPSPVEEHEPGPLVSLSPEGILTVTLHYYRDLTDFMPAMERMRVIKEMLPNARGLLFDLRAWDAADQDYGWFYTFNIMLAEVMPLCSITPVVTPGERFRMYLGYPPQSGGTSGGYSASFRVVDGLQILPASGARNIPIVYLFNARSVIPNEALAFQAAGKAAILMEGDGEMRRGSGSSNPIFAGSEPIIYG